MGKGKHLKSEGKKVDFILCRGVNKTRRNQVGRSETRQQHGLIVVQRMFTLRPACLGGFCADSG